MYFTNRFKNWMRWPLVRAHLCTLAVSVGHGSTWRAPREAARFGGAPYALALTAALLVLGAPLALLQVAIGQLSQQDAVGVWRAVPIFKGVGYLRLLVSLTGAVYTAIYLALTVSYFFYTLHNSIPFDECTQLEFTMDGYVNTFNASDCINTMFLTPVREKPEYYLAMSIVLLFIWISIPFLLYTPGKMLRRVLYVSGPVVLVVGATAAGGAARAGRLAWLLQGSAWAELARPYVWFAALTDALFTAEVAGGYLISAGDSIYANCNVKWTAVVLISTNIAATWIGLLFWYSVAGAVDMDAGPAAVLTWLYRLADDTGENAWTLVGFAALFISGLITMLTRLYPIFERIRYAGGTRWRAWCACVVCACATASLCALSGGVPALLGLERAATPLLAAIAAVLEVLAFLLVYGWKILVEDIEFLTGDKLHKIWVAGWWLVPALLVPVTVWWGAAVGAGAAGEEGPQLWAVWPPAAAGLAALIVLLVCGLVVVTGQVQYDFLGKLQSSLKPSRHWGPRDPITHYYWVSRREASFTSLFGNVSARNEPRLNISNPICPSKVVEVKKRANSDDLIYTVYRKKHLQEIYPDHYLDTFNKYRSKSLNWTNDGAKRSMNVISSIYATPVESFETVQ